MSKKFLAALAVVGFATSAMAAVTYDFTQQTGFAGKGDVQLAFGWNNAALQANASGVSFSMEATSNYTATCTWTTGEGTRGEKTHDVSHKKNSSIASTIAYDTRKNSQGQITGFNLGAMTLTSTSGGPVPVVGGACPGNPGTDGVWTSVSLVSSTGGLYVSSTLPGPATLGPVLMTATITP